MRADPWMAAMIVRREQLTSSCQMLHLRAPGALTYIAAGQTVNISLQPPVENRRVSSFTVLCTHGDSEFGLLVRSTGGRGVSDGLTAVLEPIETLWVGASAPTVSLPSPANGAKILCVVAGTGASIIGGLAENQGLRSTDVLFVGRGEDCARIPSTLTRHLAETDPNCEPRSWTTWNSTQQGRPVESDMKRLIGHEELYAAVVVCGPERFRQLVLDTCTGMGIDCEHIVTTGLESGGGVDGTFTRSSAATAVVDLFGKSHAVTWHENESLLSAMLNAGLEAPYSCRAGICSTCQCSVVIGEATMDVDLGLSDGEKTSGLVLACQLRPVSGALAVRFTAAPSTS